MQKVVKHRLDVWKEEPLYWQHMAAIENRVYASSIPRSLIELVKIRASQINKCAYCIDYHTGEALQFGESARRIFALSAWKESPLFTEVERIVLKMTEEDWDQVMEVNVKSCYNTCKALTRQMLKTRKGVIINVSSVIGLIGNAGQSNYAASKSAIIGFTKSLAKEFAPRNIRVNCIAPGFIETKMTDVMTEQQRQAILSSIPMERMGKPEDIAHAALFLASPWSEYVTGHVLTVAGGMVM